MSRVELAHDSTTPFVVLPVVESTNDTVVSRDCGLTTPGSIITAANQQHGGRALCISSEAMLLTAEVGCYQRPGPALIKRPPRKAAPR